MNVNSINTNTPLKSAQGVAMQGIEQEFSHAQNPAFKGKPWAVIKDESWLAKKTNWLGDDFNSAQQRFVSGATGILLQPWFDYNNKRVDEDTQKISCARTCAKIIAGSITGVAIRWGLIKATEAFTKNTNTEKNLVETGKKKTSDVITKFTKRQQILLPEKLKNASFRDIKKYRNTFGTVAAIGVMLVTNFIIDIPFTTFLTNKFIKLFTGKTPEEISAKQNEGGN